MRVGEIGTYTLDPSFVQFLHCSNRCPPRDLVPMTHISSVEWTCIFIALHIYNIIMVADPLLKSVTTAIELSSENLLIRTVRRGP
jgi:hypothetical protein